MTAAERWDELMTNQWHKMDTIEQNAAKAILCEVEHEQEMRRAGCAALTIDEILERTVCSDFDAVVPEPSRSRLRRLAAELVECI